MTELKERKLVKTEWNMTSKNTKKNLVAMFSCINETQNQNKEKHSMIKGVLRDNPYEIINLVWGQHLKFLKKIEKKVP